MDPRRSLIRHGLTFLTDRRFAAAGLLALAVLPAACAETPASPIRPSPTAVATFEVSPTWVPPTVTRMRPKRIAFFNCAHPKRLTPTQRRLCARPATHDTELAQRVSPQVLRVASIASAPQRIPTIDVHASGAYIPSAKTPARRYVRASIPAPAQVQSYAANAPHDHMDGAIKVYAYAAGRVFQVQAAPLRVTTLALRPGETLVDKAAGDTVRWEIGDTTSGSGSEARTLVMLKPLTAGLSTNMVLTTSQRVYLLDLSSQAKHPDAEVAWSYPDAPSVVASPKPEPAETQPLLPDPTAAVSAHYRISPQGRRPEWTPQAVFDDGRHTFIAFSALLDRGPAPLLFVDGPDGKAALVNYRQQGDLMVVDRLFDRAELRLGDSRPEVVKIAKLGARS